MLLVIALIRILPRNSAHLSRQPGGDLS